MIIVLIGTRAQLIKMAPVMMEMEKDNIGYTFILTGQHKNTIMELIYDFGIKNKPFFLYKGNEIDSVLKVPGWFILCFVNYLDLKKRTLTDPNNNRDIILVHGDTFSTLLGTVIAKITNSRLFHVEAGLRSYNLFHPFPEELTRILIFYFSDVSFCPGDFAYENMHKYKTKRINTQQNTLLDSTRQTLNKIHSDKREAGYCVCSIHRFENIFFKRRLLQIINLLKQIARHFKIRFVLHPSTRKRLIKYGLFDELQQDNAFQFMDRMIYTDFISLLSGASFVITDGGSNQEELYYMGIPTLLMRKHTERQEGLSSTVVMSKYDEIKIESFIHEYDNYRHDNPLIKQEVSPSSLIVDYLKNYS